MIRVLFPALLWVLCSSMTFADDKPNPEGVQFFEAKIRPVLVDQCYACHSAKAAENKKLQGELLLDTRAGIRKGGESGPAIVPGKVKDSLLIAALRHESFQMPPKSKLKPDVIADFVKWVEMGAPDPRDGKVALEVKPEIDIEAAREFWSFQPLKQTAPPQVKNTAWVQTDVDRFILAKLEAQGLSANSQAGKRTLIRRAYYDVWGLPPTPAEVESFVNDPSPTAYETMVDQLLAGPHYGERWARHWLDLARFAESNGYAFDKDRPGAYHYRDFVIKAFNQDLPYDQFVKLQLAGDQIAPHDALSQAATGYLAAGPFTSQQTQKERERSRYEQLDDVVGTIGTSLLGLTIGCARCHDHKFDPLPTKDYYRFTACFAETGFQDYDHDPDPAGTKAALDAFNKVHQPLVNARTSYEKDQLPKTLAAWLKTAQETPAPESLSVWQTIGPFPAADFKKAYAQVFPPETEIDLKKTYGKLKWTAQPTWKDGQVHNTLKGDNSANYLYRTIVVSQAGPLPISLGRDDAIKVWHNGQLVLQNEVAGGAAPDQEKITLQLTAGKNELLLKIINGGGPSGFYFRSSPVIPKNIQDILKLTEAKRNAKQKQTLLQWHAPRDPAWAKLNQAEQAHLKQKPKPKITKIFAARKNGTTYNFGPDTRKVYFLARGNSNTKQGLATPGFLQVLTDGKAKDTNWLNENSNPKAAPKPPRVALADWITDDQHGAGPLLARVIVNRIWQHHMGRGIVATPSDFGHQGTAPTHPELLDFLASELIRQEWKLKPIHKLILTSAVYRQTGETSPKRAAADPANQLWWRRGATRLEAEVIRDALLAVSGTLDKTMFGTGTLDQATPRRSVYLTVKRSNLIPILQLFDAPDSIQSIGHRDVTTVPPQALAMMNSPLIRQIAEKFAKRIRANPQVPMEDVVESAYAIALSRPPSDSERRQMTGFLKTQSASYGNTPQAQDRATADFCQLVFCLNEFIFVD